MATTAAAVIAKARGDVVSHFIRANAVSKESAISYVPSRRIRIRQFAKLRETDVIRAADGDRYWIDAPRYKKWSRSRRRRMVVAVGGVALIVTKVAAIAGMGR